ncbi:PepSY-associated TM helix domain-containing protein [Allopusillimonas ginsengisoli]|uniref:PepSY-associated TM helix domain-containing protein n=1 Tax=Allopusillimonas ginsengisoli TaxID=453575 RepID=UPI00101F0201|nr:PepSY-associated TM helix domain-containing protein [Allopusillimonas ginsengisoli]TEA79768.1 PepSY domain-containing protein [Allopusillimonas ginsengisoli]
MAFNGKRWLYLTHRWTGIVLCIFLAMWFLSGVVMMYVGYPKLTDQERLERLPSLSSTASLLSPAQALSRIGMDGSLRELTLSAARAGAPVYQAVFADGSRVVVDAQRGERIASTSNVIALRSAQAYAGSQIELSDEGVVDEDAFTHSRALDRHRPLHRIMLDDAAGTRLYISSTTGEVVRDASQQERGWNYVGAWIHWLYPFRGTFLDHQWANIVNWLSIGGLALTITGAIVGLLRWRFARPYRSGSRSPYPGRMMRWHHKFGLLFAAITLMWLFSGLMSMVPWGFLRSTGPAPNVAAMHGPPLSVQRLTAAPALFLSDATNVRELRWSTRLGRSVVMIRNAAGYTRMADALNGEEVRFEQAEIARAAAGLFDAPLLRTEVLQQYDFYYYDRAPHTMTGGHNRPLPVIRAQFGDDQKTWVHVDAATAEILGHTDRHGRLRRWLFQMLHSWDWLPLLNRRPLWDAVLLCLSAGGLMLSITGVVVGCRRLRLKSRAKSKH